MKNLLLSIGLCFALMGVASAQPITTERGKKSDDILLKIRKLDLLNQILPLLLTKEQINKILPPIEQARAKQKLILTQEDEELAKLQVRVDEAYKLAIEEGKYPSREFIAAVAGKTREMQLKRQLAYGEMLENVSKAVETNLTEGQKKTVYGSFIPSFIDPSKKPEDITDAEKMKFFIERVFLDPLTRELLIEIADKKKEG